MAEIHLTSNEKINTIENTEKIFELLKDDKQFLFVEERTKVIMGKGGLYENKGGQTRIKIAINKTHIIQVF